MNYLRDSIAIAMADGTQREVPSRVFGRWAVHKTTHSEPDRRLRWQITHIPTGAAAMGAPSLSMVVRAAQRLQEFEAHGQLIGKDNFGSVKTVCGGLVAWVYRGNWCLPCHDIPDITRWASAVK